MSKTHGIAIINLGITKNRFNLYYYKVTLKELTMAAIVFPLFTEFTEEETVFKE